jgi:hypothetical protein
MPSHPLTPFILTPSMVNKGQDFIVLHSMLCNISSQIKPCFPKKETFAQIISVNASQLKRPNESRKQKYSAL